VNDLPKNIGMPATTALIGRGITQLNDLTKLTELELKNLHGVGPKATKLLIEEMKKRGFSFRQEN